MADTTKMNEQIAPDGHQQPFAISEIQWRSANNEALRGFQFQGKSSSRKARRAKERAGRTRSKPAKTLPKGGF